jgi:hypothetical protein
VRRSLFVFAAVWAVATLIAHGTVTTGPPFDFRSFYTAAWCVREGLNPYDASQLSRFDNGEHVWPYLYSPFAALLVVPLTHWKMMPAFRFWTYVSAGAFGLTSAIATHRTRLPAIQAIAFAVLLGAALNVRNVFDMGQINVIVLVPIMLAIALRERRPLAAGASIAVAGLLKSSPFFLLIVFAAERRWRMLAAAAATTLAVAALTLPFAGVATWEHFFEMGERVSRLEQIPGLFPFDAKWSFSLVGITMRAGANARLVAPAITIMLTVPIALAAWRGRAGVFLSALAVMILAAPLAYVHHIIYLFPGAILAFIDAATRKRPLFAVTLLLLSFFASIDFPAEGHASSNFVALMAMYALGFLA